MTWGCPVHAVQQQLLHWPAAGCCVLPVPNVRGHPIGGMTCPAVPSADATALYRPPMPALHSWGEHGCWQVHPPLGTHPKQMCMNCCTCDMQSRLKACEKHQHMRKMQLSALQPCTHLSDPAVRCALSPVICGWYCICVASVESWSKRDSDTLPAKPRLGFGGGGLAGALDAGHARAASAALATFAV